MAYMMAWFLILMASGSGPGAIGVTDQHVLTGSSNYTQHSVLPTFKNIRRPPITKSPGTFQRMKER